MGICMFKDVHLYRLALQEALHSCLPSGAVPLNVYRPCNKTLKSVSAEKRQQFGVAY